MLTFHLMKYRHKKGKRHFTGQLTPQKSGEKSENQNIGIAWLEYELELIKVI